MNSRSGFPVIPSFRSFQLSGHSGYSPVILISKFKKDKRT